MEGTMMMMMTTHMTITVMPMAAVSQVCHPSNPHTTSVRTFFRELNVSGWRFPFDIT